MQSRTQPRHDVVIVGGGAAGLAAAASLLRRRPGLDIAVIEPKDVHDYQPGWTMVGAGVFDRAATQRPMAGCMPGGVTWIREAVAGFEPANNRVRLASGAVVGYGALVAAPGLRLAWEGVEGLAETLGANGVTSNYLAELAPYTWELARQTTGGRAIFTQPEMPIKCAGAPQKAMYLSCDHWRRRGSASPAVEFHTANAALFGVAHYVPPLMDYVGRYGIDLNLNSKLVAVDGPRRRAVFRSIAPDGEARETVRDFDMLHVCPPQAALQVVAESPLAGPGGWIEVDQATLRHTRFENVFALGDAASTPNAKTAAAARKQAPVVAENLLAHLDGRPLAAAYDGYGSCPLTVERGRIVLAEFGYGGRLLPSFPAFVLDGVRPTRRAWMLKEKVLPFLYWNGMLKGREWLAAPKRAA